MLGDEPSVLSAAEETTQQIVQKLYFADKHTLVSPGVTYDPSLRYDVYSLTSQLHVHKINKIMF